MLPYLDSQQKIPTYGVCFFIGIIAAVIFAILLVKKSSIKFDDLAYSTSFALIGGIIGAKLLSILTSIDLIIKYNLDIVYIIKHGFVFYGGLIGGLLGYVVYAIIFKVSILKLLDIAAACLPIGQVFGRIGCLCAGCCFGRPTNLPIGVVYTNPISQSTPANIPLLPTQIFESIYCLIIFVILQILYRKFKEDKGIITTIYAISYGVCRFINEFFRYDAERGFVGILSTSQFISLILIIVGVAFLFIKKTTYYKKIEKAL